MQINTITLALLGLLAGNTVLAAPSVEERAVTKSHDGTLVCGNFATGTKKDVYNLTNDLSDGGKIGNKRFTVGPRSCQRIHCWNTSAVYICNDQGRTISLLGKEVYPDAVAIPRHCCPSRDLDSANEYKAGVSGQKFHRTGGFNYNLVVGYGHCGHSIHVKPDREGGWGVNWSCKYPILKPDTSW